MSSLAAALPRRYSQDLPILAPVVAPDGRPEKRRKEEPKGDEPRGEVGLGVIIGDGVMNASWPRLDTVRLDTESPRPKPRRTASDRRGSRDLGMVQGPVLDAHARPLRSG